MLPYYALNFFPFSRILQFYESTSSPSIMRKLTIIHLFHSPSATHLLFFFVVKREVVFIVLNCTFLSFTTFHSKFNGLGSWVFLVEWNKIANFHLHSTLISHHSFHSLSLFPIKNGRESGWWLETGSGVITHWQCFNWLVVCRVVAREIQIKTSTQTFISP